MLAASESGDGSSTPAQVTKAEGPGRNDMVTIKNGEETRTMKYKKAEALINEGWELVR